MDGQNNNAIINKTLQFSLDIIEYCEKLDTAGKYVISKQLLRSGTSIGANAHEAQNPSSKNDFIHKMKIAAKEAEETKYWLYLCEHSKNYPFDDRLKNQILEISKIIYKILSTSLQSK
ncbi:MULTISPECIES: four helix bundle protein [unclassified Chryseobacterium]|uniref:four helix bundle protein n=1 Tax=unclassified Chryseobacterium TaxID=2593645 RepID=UPI001AE8C0F3|nr:MULTISPECIES: four helix bundle protein [unclassified Chryseobacterium]MBP1165938.1 four helix bundle protein [Chryseobacterium sp. PvR013]MDR4894895.1 four helix bundle protein [Chryseobacterium sp. CFS7]